MDKMPPTKRRSGFCEQDCIQIDVDITGSDCLSFKALVVGVWRQPDSLGVVGDRTVRPGCDPPECLVFLHSFAGCRRVAVCLVRLACAGPTLDLPVPDGGAGTVSAVAGSVC